MKFSRILTVAMATLSFPLVAAETTDVLRVGDQLRSEERRQRRAGRIVSTATRQIDALLKDLESNQLFDKEGGKETAAMNQQLLELSTRNIPVAASHLGRAREDVGSAAPHIKKADAEVARILEELGKILTETSSVLAEDKILAQLNGLIDAEEDLKENTEKWGRKVILDRKSATADTGRLSRLQQAVVPQYADFFALLERTQGQTTDADAGQRFSTAIAALRKHNPDVQIRKAAKSIEKVKALDAITAQQAVIKALKDSRDILTAGNERDDNVADILLGKLVEKQQELQVAIKESGRDFRDQQSELEARQMELSQAVEQLKQNQKEAAQQAAQQAQQLQQQSPQESPMQAAAEAAQQAAEAEQQAAEALTAAAEKIQEAQKALEKGDQQAAEQAAAEAAEALEQAKEATSAATSASELMNEAMEESFPAVEEESPSPATMATSPGELPGVEATDSESETQDDRSSEDPAETAAQGEGEETGDIAGSEMPEGEGKMPGSVGKSETSTGDGDTPIGKPSGQPSTASKTNPRDPNKPKEQGPKGSGPPKSGESPGEPQMAGEPGEAPQIGSSSSTQVAGEAAAINKLVADVFKRGEKKGGLQEYLPQLPAEFRNQIKEYYEVLAQ